MLLVSLLIILTSSLHGLKIKLADTSPISISKDWVRGIISRQGEKICPYTIDENSAGIGKGLGKIRYHISNAACLNDAHNDYWNEVTKIVETNSDEISTTLLIYNDLFANVEDFEIFSEELDDEIKNRDIESIINNVYFHPDFNFRDKDGQNVLIFDEEGNIIGESTKIIRPSSYARRSPYPIVNILRSEQVQEAQKFVTEGKIFQQNVEKLDKIGSQKLQKMLDSCNWNELLHNNSLNSNESCNENNDQNDNDDQDDDDDQVDDDDIIDLNDYIGLAEKYIN